jgi:hypothetical protein
VIVGGLVLSRSRLRRYPLGFANGSCNTRVFGTISMGRVERDKTRANLMHKQMFTLRYNFMAS